jgi:hypothetical protein
VGLEKSIRIIEREFDRMNQEKALVRSVRVERLENGYVVTVENHGKRYVARNRSELMMLLVEIGMVFE